MIGNRKVDTFSVKLASGCIGAYLAIIVSSQPVDTFRTYVKRNRIQGSENMLCTYIQPSMKQSKRPLSIRCIYPTSSTTASYISQSTNSV